MGIKSSFNKFLKDMCSEIFVATHISEYAYKKVAIDVSLYLHKFKAVCGDRWLSAIIGLISSLRNNEIHCVFIFDGKAPPEKELEREKRRDTRKKLEEHLYKLEEAFEEYSKTGVIRECIKELCNRRRSPQHKRLLSKMSSNIDMKWVEIKIKQRRNQLYEINPNDFNIVKELLDILKVPFYTAPWEAEKMCAKLCIDGKVDAVMSEDTDVMAYGAPVFLTKFESSTNTCVSITHSSILDCLGIDKDKFLDLCIMCGTDYNHNIPRVGSKTAYKNIIKHGNIEQISNETELDVSILNHVRVRQLFTEFDDYKLDNIPFCGVPDFEKLDKFNIDNKVYVNIQDIRKNFEQKDILFEDSDEEKETE